MSAKIITKMDGSVKPSKPRKNQRKKVAKKQNLTKRERRQLKLKSKRHSSVVLKLLPEWELLRREDTSKEKRFNLIENILTMTKNILLDLCMAHDTARIIECAIQYGTEAQRWTIFGQLKPNLRLLAKSRYAKHIVQKMIKYGAKEHRLEVMKVFRGHVARLVKHRISSELVDLLYNDYANATERASLMQELYGNVHALKLAENRIQSLSDALITNPDRKKIIMNNLTELLTSLANKSLTKYSIVQRLLLEYLQAQLNVSTIPSNENNTNSITETEHEPVTTKEVETGLHGLLETLVDGGHIVPMLHTRDGVRAALHVLWASPVRLRKVLVKGLKSCVASIARDEHGHLFLIGVLDAVDDIVLLEKFVIKEILADLDLFCIHPEARKVLLYALSPRDPRHFSPQLQQSLLYPGDLSPYTCKALGVRAIELRSFKSRLLPQLLKLVSERLTDLFTGDDSEAGRLASEDRGRLVLLCEILLRSASHHLDPEAVLSTYRRSRDSPESENVSSTKSSLTQSSTELERIRLLRSTALEKLVKVLLVPEFRPAGLQVLPTKTSSMLSRNELRMKRHRKAILRAEQSLISQNKPKFGLFESGQPMDIVEEVAKDDEDIDMDILSDKTNVRLSFVERPEGQLLLRWLLQDGRKYKDFTLGRLILQHVSASNLLAWTRCNRSCFVLVNLYELRDPKVCRSLRVILAPVMDELSVSPLPGAKVLLKLLQTGARDKSN